MNYVYYFTDAHDRIIYVGKTCDIKKRMRRHFAGGHLPSDCYSSVNRIFYAETGFGKYNTEIIETILIDKYKPLYNTEKLFMEKAERLCFVPPELEWKEIFVEYYSDKVAISFSDPGYRCFDQSFSSRERADSLVSYNLGKLHFRRKYVEEKIPDIVRENEAIVKEAEKLCRRIIVDYERSSTDWTLNQEEYGAAYIGFITYWKIDELMVESGLIFKTEGGAYGMPLYSDGALEECNRIYLERRKERSKSEFCAI